MTEEADCHLPFVVCCGWSKPLELQLTSTMETSDWTLHHKDHRDPCHFHHCLIPPPTRHQKGLNMCTHRELIREINNEDFFLCSQMRPLCAFLAITVSPIDKHIVGDCVIGNIFDEKCLGSAWLSVATPLTVRAAHVDDDLQGRLLGCQQGRCLPQLLLPPLDKNNQPCESTLY